MKVGDLVVCNCASDTWYKGVPGIIVKKSKFSTMVCIKGKVIELAASVSDNLEVLRESR